MTVGAEGAAPADAAAPSQGADPNAAPAEGAQTDPAQSEDADAAAAAAQAAVDATKQKRGESDADFNVRMSKVKREARLAREEAQRYKQAHSQAEEALKLTRAELEQAKKGKLSRRRYLEVTRAINEAGEDDAKIAALFDEDDLDSVPKALRDKIEGLDKKLREKEEQERRQNQGAVWQKEVGIVANTLTQLAEDCPLYEAFPDAASHVLNGWHAEWRRRGGTLDVRPDIEEIAVEMHKPIAANLVRALQSAKARSFLLSINPELKALLGGHETAAGGPTRDAQGAGRGTGPAAKTPSPTVQSPTSVSTNLKSRMELEEEEAERSRAAYREYQLSLQNQR